MHAVSARARPDAWQLHRFQQRLGARHLEEGALARSASAQAARTKTSTGASRAACRAAGSAVTDTRACARLSNSAAEAARTTGASCTRAAGSVRTSALTAKTRESPVGATRFAVWSEAA